MPAIMTELKQDEILRAIEDLTRRVTQTEQATQEIRETVQPLTGLLRLVDRPEDQDPALGRQLVDLLTGIRQEQLEARTRMERIEARITELRDDLGLLFDADVPDGH